MLKSIVCLRSLVNSLTSDNHIGSGSYSEKITDGIVITTWVVKHNEDSISFSVWDFAGQTVYYNTHQVCESVPYSHQHHHQLYEVDRVYMASLQYHNHDKLCASILSWRHNWSYFVKPSFPWVSRLIFLEPAARITNGGVHLKVAFWHGMLSKNKDSWLRECLHYVTGWYHCILTMFWEFHVESLQWLHRSHEKSFGLGFRK